MSARKEDALKARLDAARATELALRLQIEYLCQQLSAEKQLTWYYFKKWERILESSATASLPDR